MKRAAAFLITVYISIPIILYLFPWILSHAVFCHLVRFPLFVDFDKPEDFSLNHTRNFYLTTEEGITVGIWHTLPVDSQWGEAPGREPEWYSEALGDGHPVIIYLHGNMGTRAINHRVELMKILSAAGYHVLSLDYRGFGDSSGEPSEAGMTTDALYLYQWVKQRSNRSLVCLWGHSLGTGYFHLLGSHVDALILEAPFTKIGEVVVRYPLCKIHMFLPGFESLIWKLLEMNNIEFANDKNLETITSPLLLLHAEDDDVVTCHMSQRLYQIALQAQTERHAENQVHLVLYNASLEYSHNNIYRDPNLSRDVGRFLLNL
ncbi:lysophosphatidylserine lipase ABHD12-like [Aplochiton taeniatus]